MEHLFAERVSVPAQSVSKPKTEVEQSKPTPYSAEVDPNAQPVSEAPEEKKDEVQDGNEEVIESTDAEKAVAATKIGAVYRGKKARKEV